MKHYSLRKVFQISIGILAMVLIFIIIKPQKVNIVLRAMDIEKVILSFLFALLYYLVSGLGVLVLIVKKVTFGELVFLLITYLKVQTFNVFIPGHLGDLVIIKLYKQWGTPGKIGAALFVDKAITILSVAAISIFGAIFISSEKLLIAFVIAIVIIILSFLLLLNKSFHSFINSLLQGKWSQILLDFSNALMLYKQDNYKKLIQNFVLTLCRFFLLGIAGMFMYESVSISLGLFIPTFGATTAMLTSLIPISIMGIGTLEAYAIFYYGLFGISAPIVLAVTLVARARNLLLLGIFSLLGIINREPQRSE